MSQIRDNGPQRVKRMTSYKSTKYRHFELNVVQPIRHGRTSRLLALALLLVCIKTVLGKFTDYISPSADCVTICRLASSLTEDRANSHANSHIVWNIYTRNKKHKTWIGQFLYTHLIIIIFTTNKKKQEVVNIN